MPPIRCNHDPCSRIFGLPDRRAKSRARVLRFCESELRWKQRSTYGPFQRHFHCCFHPVRKVPFLDTICKTNKILNCYSKTIFCKVFRCLYVVSLSRLSCLLVIGPNDQTMKPSDVTSRLVSKKITYLLLVSSLLLHVKISLFY